MMHSLHRVYDVLGWVPRYDALYAVPRYGVFYGTLWLGTVYSTVSFLPRVSIAWLE